MFKKILIANRGEIACRVVKTARKMGIKTVAVYSDADADALHVEMADEAVHIGPPQAAQSYLLIDRIVEAAKSTGAEAVHPGYGFLSERALFPEALEAAGIAFIGPRPHAIRAMGDKIESKKLANAANVSTVPGYLGEIADVVHAKRIAHEIGYPVMIKASAGGGGKGMRVAHDDASLTEGFASARNEARSAFGDDRVFIEKFAAEPRHIEIQVLADGHGNAVYLFERECSIQRRHQKVIEEAPSPFLDDKTRRAMGEQAVALAKAVQYQSAGTVEFIVDKDRNFYFLEMNTRLQVEHPVTELITGIDLVEQMIRVAAGEKLAFTQKDLSIKGWAVESRVYAEDPFRGFMPSTGRLVRYRPPQEGKTGGLTLRNDTGVYEGAEISVFYDPMIAKLCTHGPTRAEAIDHAIRALDEFEIAGIQHNVPFLAALLDHKQFRSGKITTGFIAENYPDGFHGAELPIEARRALMAIAAYLEVREVDRAQTITGQLPGRGRKIAADWVATCGAERAGIQVSWTDHSADIDLDGQKFAVRGAWDPGQSLFKGEVNARPMSVQIRRQVDAWRCVHRGAALTIAVRSPRAAELAALMPVKTPPDLSRFLLCPMPGLVVSIPVEVGQDVKAGEILAIVEAMKMENVLKAERDGTVAKINAKQGDSLAVDAVILEFA